MDAPVYPARRHSADGLDLASEAVRLSFQESRKMDLSKLSVLELLKRHARLEGELDEELRSRDIRRTGNNLTGDIAEHLFCTACKWHQEPSSRAGFDAIGKADGKHYQIKARRIIRDNASSRQLSAIRNLLEKGILIFSRDCCSTRITA